MIDWNLIEVGRVDSSNEYLKLLGKNGAVEGTAVRALSQSAGRGRQGNSWYSPPGLGLYLSWLLRPPLSFDKYDLLASLTAVPVIKALQSMFKIDVAIKWPNDIVADRKKLGGILGETFGRGTSNPFVVIGLGINCLHTKEDFPPELKKTAISLSRLSVPCEPAVLCLPILESFGLLYTDILQGNILPWRREYRKRCISLGQRICRQGEEGMALDIDEMGRLLVRHDDGSVTKWHSI